jgi:hypothetical protein
MYDFTMGHKELKKMSLQSCSMKVFNKCDKEMCTFSMQLIPCRKIELIGISFPSMRKSIKQVVGMQNLCSSAYIFTDHVGDIQIVVL